MTTLATGLLTNVITALRGDPQQGIEPVFGGRKSVPTAVRIQRILAKFREFDAAWREEELNPAIVEFTDGGDRVEPEDFPEFMTQYEDIFNKQVEVDIEPLRLEEIESLDVTNDDAFDLLTSLGIITTE